MRHVNARTLEEAVSLLSKYKGAAKIIAGGVDLVSLMKSRVAAPKALINIKTIPDLAYIRSDSGSVRIGALTIVHELEQSSIIRDICPVIAQAAYSVAAPQIRNMATIGGNLSQEVQCGYYRRPAITGISFNCYRKGGKRCYAVAGENAEHAIFNGDKCYAVCPSDIAPALVALGVTLMIAGPAGERIVPLDKFYTTLGNVLAHNEILREIRIPPPKPGTRQQYLKFRLRKTIDFAIASVTAAITSESGVVRNARIVLGGVAPMPYRALRAEDCLIGKTITENLAEESARVTGSEAVPLSGNGHKLSIAMALIKRAVIMAQ